MRALIPLACIVILAACTPAPDPEKTAAPSNPPPAAPAATPEPFAGDINALGTEPFWAVEVRETSLTLKQPGVPDVSAPNPTPRVEAGRAVWEANGMTLTLTDGACSDGMSDRSYPWTAELLVAGTTLKGCAIKAQDLADQPRP